MEQVVYLDDFFNFLEENGINTDVIKVVDNEIDLDYVMEEDRSCEIKRLYNSFLNIKKNTDSSSEWAVGIFYLLIYTINDNFLSWME